jgi:putative restriction endonuclease
VYSAEEEAAIRLDIFAWLERRISSGQYEFGYADLASYTYLGAPIPLMDRGRGIRNPAAFRSTLSIRSTASSTYEDGGDLEAVVDYNYRSGESADNTKLHEAVDRQSPLIYFFEVRKSRYVAYFPVYAVASDPVAKTFSIAMDESFTFFGDPLDMTVDEKRYADRIVRTRLHQPAFRAKVMHAYTNTCAICRLKHADLLDAAHIVPDFKEAGFASVNNGLALCKIHHAAYDRNLLGITPRFRVERVCCRFG